jgi:hypothetical protein
MTQLPARIHVLLARDQPRGVVIRRGPSRSVCTILWDCVRDEFQLGQWLKGRIYERRSDLSPDGKYLIYFAMNGKWNSETKGAWTAISRAPYLKAIALFAKGDCWNGGGLFAGRNTYWLNDGYGHLYFPLTESRVVVRDGKPGDPTFTCIVIHDPRYKEPLLLLTNLGISGAVALALYQHRWPIEPVPLVGKQMLGAQRQYLFAPESRQRLPELALLASSILSYEAATSPAIPTGFWDRAPRPTAGRLRRVLSRVSLSELGALPARIRERRRRRRICPRAWRHTGGRSGSRPLLTPCPWPYRAGGHRKLGWGVTGRKRWRSWMTLRHRSTTTRRSGTCGW